MITLEQVKSDDDNFYISLTKLTGLKIKDIEGYFIKEWGDVTFKISRIRFEDDQTCYVEGEHDLPYLSLYGTDIPNTDQEIWERLYQERGDEE